MALALVWGYWALKNTPLDALPDLSDTQVIIYTEWTGRSPDLVEDQVTYPLPRRSWRPRRSRLCGVFLLGKLLHLRHLRGRDRYLLGAEPDPGIPPAVKNKIPSDVNPFSVPMPPASGGGSPMPLSMKRAGTIWPNCAACRTISSSWAWKAYPAFPRWRVSRLCKAVSDHRRSQPPGSLQHSHYEGPGGCKKEQPGCGGARP